MGDVSVEEAAKRLARELEAWLAENRRNLNEEAVRVLKSMGREDQQRVLRGGPLELCRDMAAVFRSRVVLGREREQQLAERKGVDPAKFAKPATGEEVRQWLEANKEYIPEPALAEFTALSREDKWRVISEGGLRECVDAAYVIEKRAERTKELSSQVAALFAARREQLEASKTKTAPAEIKVAPRVAAAMQAVYTSYVGREVPAHLRRCSGYENVEPEPERPVLVGKVKGVGGVIEILRQKYGCSKGQRLQVIGEHGGPAGMWRLEDDKTVPKTHFKEGGWRWVLEQEDPPKKKPHLSHPEVVPAESRSPEAERLEAAAASKEKSPSRSCSRNRSQSTVGKRNTSASKSNERRKRRMSSDECQDHEDKKDRGKRKSSKGANRHDKLPAAKERGRRKCKDGGNGSSASEKESSSAGERSQASKTKHRDRGKRRRRD